MGQDFGINPQLGLSLKMMQGPDERAMTRAKLADIQTQVDERRNAATKTGLENQQAQVKFSAQTAVRKMLQDKQAAGQDPTAADFIAAGGPVEGVNAAKAYNDTIKQQLDQHKQQTDEMQKGVDALGNLANDMLSTKDPVQRAAKRDQGIAALHGVNGGILDPKLADQFMKNGLTDSELTTWVNQSKAAMDQSLALRKQSLDEATKKQADAFKIIDQKAAADKLTQDQAQLAETTRHNKAEEGMPKSFPAGSLIKTPGQPDQTVPKEETPRNIDPNSPEGIAAAIAKSNGGYHAPAVQLVPTTDDNGNKVQKFVPKVAGGPAIAAAPTANEQNRRDQASIVSSEADRISAMIDANPSAVGPLLGRIAKGETVVGTVSPEAKALGTALGSFKALQPILHGFRGGSQTVDHFDSVIGDQSLNAAALKAALGQIKILAEKIKKGQVEEDGTGAVRKYNPATGKIE